MGEKLSLARIKKFGQNFEVSVDPELALKFKNGELEHVRDCLQSEQVFSDAKKALVVSPTELVKVFQTDNPLKVAEIIIREGEIQLTAEHRAKEREQKLKYLVNLIHKQAVDPKTGYPHPPQRIEAALVQGKITLDYNKPVEEQFADIIAKLRSILPLSIEQKMLQITIPATHVGKCNQIIRSTGKLLQEDWKTDGSWSVKLEISAGMQQELIDKLNSITHGEVLVDILENN